MLATHAARVLKPLSIGYDQPSQNGRKDLDELFTPWRLSGPPVDGRNPAPEKPWN